MGCSTKSLRVTFPRFLSTHEAQTTLDPRKNPWRALGEELPVK